MLQCNYKSKNRRAINPINAFQSDRNRENFLQYTAFEIPNDVNKLNQIVKLNVLFQIINVDISGINYAFINITYICTVFEVSSTRTPNENLISWHPRQSKIKLN